jgi:hypothetical protein
LERGLALKNKFTTKNTVVKTRDFNAKTPRPQRSAKKNQPKNRHTRTCSGHFQWMAGSRPAMTMIKELCVPWRSSRLGVEE